MAGQVHLLAFVVAYHGEAVAAEECKARITAVLPLQTPLMSLQHITIPDEQLALRVAELIALFAGVRSEPN